MEENRLYVGGLPYSYNEEQLKKLFNDAGTVIDARIITDKYSGRSKGYGFVEMGNQEEAQKAIEMINGKEVDGRKLTVNIARPKEERPSS